MALDANRTQDLTNIIMCVYVLLLIVFQQSIHPKQIHSHLALYLHSKEYFGFLASFLLRVALLEDFIELQIANYAAQNIEWSRIWAKNWRLVEKHMLEFLSLTEYDKDRAVTLQLEFLGEHMLNYDVPFQQEAVDFYKLYKENGEKFGNKIIEGSNP